MIDASSRSSPQPDARARFPFGRILLSAILLGITLHFHSTTVAFADQLVSYQVQDGDTLLALANHFNVDPDDLAATNGMDDPDVLAIGQKLLVRVPSPANPFGLMVPDRWDDVIDGVQRAREPDAAAAEVMEPGPLPPSLLKMIATIGPVSALQIWQPSTARPAVMPAPSYSQYDGTEWAGSNCGPTALSMGLAAIGINADQVSLRLQANQQMGSSDPVEGTSWESLEGAARSAGAGTKGLVGANGYRAWSIGDVKKEISLGHPVLLLLRYRLIPDHSDSAFDGDHYIVALGFDQQGNLVYNDPAGNVAHGNRRRLTPDELERAWSNTWAGQDHTAMALYQ